MNQIIYPPAAETDLDKLECVYALLEQARLEHNRQGAIARSNPEKYIKTGRWYLYALRPQRLGGNIFWEMTLPLLQEQNRLRDSIRRAEYTDKQWMALSDEERDAIFISLFGDKEALKRKPTEATYSPLVDLKAISLDQFEKTEVPDPTEDFTTYTEVDEDGDITVTADRITVDTMRRDALSYVRHDKGSGHFGDFEHLVAISLGTFEDGGLYANWAITNGSNTVSQMGTNSEGLVAYSVRSLGDSILYLYFRDYAGAGDYDLFGSIPTGQHWLTIERASTTGTCKIYSDASRETLEDTLSITCGTGTYQYIFGLMSCEITNYGDRVASGYSEYLDLGEGGVTEKSSSDSGTGADAIASANPIATLTATETGSGVELATLIAVLILGDSGIGYDLSGLPEDIFGVDEGGGFDALKALIETTDSGSDMRLHDRPGQVRMPSKGVNL